MRQKLTSIATVWMCLPKSGVTGEKFGASACHPLIFPSWASPTTRVGRLEASRVAAAEPSSVLVRRVRPVRFGVFLRLSSAR